MTPVESILKRGIGRMDRMMEVMNLTKLRCKHFCKCHEVPPVQ
jgi:hypothetical protein